MKTYYLYRFFDAEGALLYIGVTYDVQIRAVRHKCKSEWFSEAHHMSVECVGTHKRIAWAAEKEAINFERPKYNINSLKRNGVTPTEKFMLNKSNMTLLRNSGLTYQAIADKFGISRQRVHQILKSPN